MFVFFANEVWLGVIRLRSVWAALSNISKELTFSLLNFLPAKFLRAPSFALVLFLNLNFGAPLVLSVVFCCLWESMLCAVSPPEALGFCGRVERTEEDQHKVRLTEGHGDVKRHEALRKETPQYTWTHICLH